MVSYGGRDYFPAVSVIINAVIKTIPNGDDNGKRTLCRVYSLTMIALKPHSASHEPQSTQSSVIS